MANMINLFTVEGRVGKVIDREDYTGLLINCVESWYDQKTNQMNESDNWMNVNFFGRLKKLVIDNVDVGDRVICTGTLFSFPKDAPNPRILLRGNQFRILRRYIETAKRTDNDETQGHEHDQGDAV